MMVQFLRDRWRVISYSGTEYAKTSLETKDIVLLNRSWVVLMMTQTACFISHIINGLQRSAWMTAFFIAGLFIIQIFIRIGRVNSAKISAIAVINVNTVLMGIFFGIQSHVIDFLL